MRDCCLSAHQQDVAAPHNIPVIQAHTPDLRQEESAQQILLGMTTTALKRVQQFGFEFARCLTHLLLV